MTTIYDTLLCNMGIFSRALRFLRRYLFEDPLYVLVYSFGLLMPRFVSSIYFYTEEEIFDQLKQGKSILRIGDGEINLLLGLRNHYQSFNRRLQADMRAMVRGYSVDAPYILSVPRFVNVSNSELKDMNKFHVWLPLKVMFWLYFKKKTPYLDAHAFYYDGYFERVISPYLQGRKVFLVTREETIKRQLANKALPFKFTPIVVPEQELLSQQDVVQARIMATVGESERESSTILFAAGPVGKVICYFLAQKGIQGLDIGKVAEVMHFGDSIESLV